MGTAGLLAGRETGYRYRCFKCGKIDWKWAWLAERRERRLEMNTADLEVGIEDGHGWLGGGKGDWRWARLVWKWEGRHRAADRSKIMSSARRLMRPDGQAGRRA